MLHGESRLCSQLKKAWNNYDEDEDDNHGRYPYQLYVGVLGKQPHTRIHICIYLVCIYVCIRIIILIVQGKPYQFRNNQVSSHFISSKMWGIFHQYSQKGWSECRFVVYAIISASFLFVLPWKWWSYVEDISKNWFCLEPVTQNAWSPASKRR